MVDPDDSLMHVSLMKNLESVRELHYHYKVLILDKDEKVWSVLTKQDKFHKIHTFRQGECILLELDG
jgi:predicted transcriptional regulator